MDDLLDEIDQTPGRRADSLRETDVRQALDTAARLTRGLIFALAEDHHQRVKRGQPQLSRQIWDCARAKVEEVRSTAVRVALDHQLELPPFNQYGTDDWCPPRLAAPDASTPEVTGGLEAADAIVRATWKQLDASLSQLHELQKDPATRTG